jgi:hypothetical protein
MFMPQKVKLLMFAGFSVENGFEMTS